MSRFCNFGIDVCKHNYAYCDNLLSPRYSIYYEYKELCFDYCLSPNICYYLNINLTSRYNNYEN